MGDWDVTKVGRRCMPYLSAVSGRVERMTKSIVIVLAYPVRACVLVVGRIGRLLVGLLLGLGTCHWVVNGIRPKY